MDRLKIKNLPWRGLSLAAAVAYITFPGLPRWPLVPLGLLAFLGGMRAILSLLFLGGYLLSWGQINYRAAHIYLPYPPEEVQWIEGKLKEEPRWDSQKNIRYTLGVERLGHRQGGGESMGWGLLRGSLPWEEAPNPEDWLRGDSLRLKGRLTQGKDGRFYFYADSLQGRIIQERNQLRRGLIRTIRLRSKRISQQGAVLLPALVLGLGHPEFSTVSALFKQTGTAHIIALSGFHAGLVGLLLYSFFRLLLGHRGGLILSSWGLLFFLYLVGPKPSLLRAVLMFQIILWGKIFHERVSPKGALIGSYLFMGMIAPASLRTLSAQLSYLALWGILSSTPRIQQNLGRLPWRWLQASVSASLAAQLWTLPLVLYQFGVYYPSGLLASLIFLPLIASYVYLGIFYLFLPPDFFPSSLLAKLCTLLEELLFTLTGIFQKIPSFSLGEGKKALFFLLLIPLLWDYIYSPGGVNWKSTILTTTRLHKSKLF